MAASEGTYPNQYYKQNNLLILILYNGGLLLLEELAQDKRLNAVDYFIKEPLVSSASTIVTS